MSAYDPLRTLRSQSSFGQMRRLTLAFALLLAGCDAWPTVVDNQTPNPITIRYFQRDYDHWSAVFPIKSGVAIRLARGHWIQDILGLEIKDDDHIYQFSGHAIRRLEGACPSNKLSRKLSFAPDCYLVYQGRGRITLSAREPGGIIYDQLGKGR